MPGSLTFDLNAEAAKLIANHPDTMPGDNKAIVDLGFKTVFAQKSEDGRWEVHGEVDYSTKAGLGLGVGGVFSWGDKRS